RLRGVRRPSAAIELPGRLGGPIRATNRPGPDVGTRPFDSTGEKPQGPTVTPVAEALAMEKPARRFGEMPVLPARTAGAATSSVVRARSNATRSRTGRCGRGCCQVMAFGHSSGGVADVDEAESRGKAAAPVAA